MLTSRLVDSLSSSHKSSIRFLVNMVKDDNKELTGKTFSRNCAETNVARSNLSSSSVKKSMEYFCVPAGQDWRVDMVLELLNLREGSLEIDDLESDEVTTLINYLCTT